MGKNKPSKEAIAQAMLLPEGQRIANKTATTKDWIVVLYAAEAIQETWGIVEARYLVKKNENISSLRAE